MSREDAIKIIMLTNSNYKEAIKHLNNGTTIYRIDEYNDFARTFSLIEESEIEECWHNLETVKYHGVIYKIEFVL